jgi:hypothetical protein
VRGIAHAGKGAGYVVGKRRLVFRKISHNHRAFDAEYLGMKTKKRSQETPATPTEAAIAAAAQRIWEDEGRPDGKAEEHWNRAEEQLRSQSSDGAPEEDEEA